MEICSPKDGFVKEIRVADGTPITAGTVILIMEDDEESSSEKRLEMLEATKDIMSEKWRGKQYQDDLRLAELAVKTAEVVRDVAAALFGISSKRNQMGLETETGRLQNEAASARAEFEWERAKTQLERLKNTADLSRRAYEAVKANLEFQRKYIESQRARLIVKAPIDGTLALKVAAGMFAELGSTLADIIPAGVGRG